MLFTSVEWLPVELREWPIDTVGGDAVSTSETRLATAPSATGSESLTAAMPRATGVPGGMAPAPAPLP